MQYSRLVTLEKEMKNIMAARRYPLFRMSPDVLTTYVCLLIMGMLFYDPKGFGAPGIEVKRASGLQDRKIGALGLHTSTQGFCLARTIIFFRVREEKGFGHRVSRKKIRGSRAPKIPF